MPRSMHLICDPSAFMPPLRGSPFLPPLVPARISSKLLHARHIHTLGWLGSNNHVTCALNVQESSGFKGGVLCSPPKLPSSCPST
jgi:hypothetical protein